MTKLFIIDNRLTKIKTKAMCKEVLEWIKEQDTPLTFKTTKNNMITITQDETTPENYLFYHHTGKIEWLTPGLSMDEEDAVDELYKNRKYYNAKWAD